MPAPRFFYPDTPELPLPEKHRFPISKYRLLHERASTESLLGRGVLSPSPVASVEQLLRIHSSDYVMAVLRGSLSRQEQRRIGLPWSPTLARRSRATVGGSIAAAREALETGISGQLAGGTHHAHRDYGSGYCVFNDLAAAALAVLDDGLARRVAILDLDVHQGDGNATILGPEPDVFVASLHGERNFPFTKEQSDFDIALPDETSDQPYLEEVAHALDAIEGFGPDLVLYLAGVDPLKADSLGRLSLTPDGLRRRDQQVFETCRRRGTPVAFVAGGGYCKPIDATVDAYAATLEEARLVFGL